jgi:hypothetical protein
MQVADKVIFPGHDIRFLAKRSYAAVNAGSLSPLRPIIQSALRAGPVMTLAWLHF